MKSHVWRPLYVALGIVAMILVLRMFIVPDDFGAHERGYMYGWHSKGNEAVWQKVSVKYKGGDSCKECHKDNYEDIKNSPHTDISCENCHGPRLEHPKDPIGLNIDRSRQLCLRCHLKLPYKASDRGTMKGINPDTHHPQEQCVLCHYPHNPTREAKK
ncbi:MAG: cytochrome C [Desulfuromonadales bacterium]